MPKKCIGKKHKLTPKNVTQKWEIRLILFIANPYNIGNQLINPT